MGRVLGRDIGKKGEGTRRAVVICDGKVQRREAVVGEG
jgi:hypothetical protein